MPKYIYKEKLLRELNLFDAKDILSSCDENITPLIAVKGILLAVIRTVFQMPEEPVSTVKSGKWEVHKNKLLNLYDHTCSICWASFTSTHRKDQQYSYCPFCGAKLEADGEEKTEDGDEL